MITLYIKPSAQPEHHTHEVRATLTHTLFLLADETGLYCFDRRSRSQHVLTWEEVLKLLPQEVMRGLLAAHGFRDSMEKIQHMAGCSPEDLGKVSQSILDMAAPRFSREGG